MIDFDIESCRIAACRSVAMIVAFRRWAKLTGLDNDVMKTFEMDQREAAAHLQQVERVWSKDDTLKRVQRFGKY